MNFCVRLLSWHLIYMTVSARIYNKLDTKVAVFYSLLKIIILRTHNKTL